MAEPDRTRILVISVADTIDRDVVIDLVRGSGCAEAHVVAPVHAPGRLTTARDQLDGILNLLVELEVPATGTIGDKGADPLAVCDAALERWPADEAVLLIDAADDVASWELQIAEHGVLRHGAPITVLPGSADDLAAA